MNNPYQAPQAAIAREEPLEGALFYSVSKRKFWVLQLCTLGLYILGWAYQNWKILKANYKLNVWPVPRAIFIVFFTHDLMKRIKTASDANGRYTQFNYSGAATNAVVVFIVNFIIDRLVNKGVGGLGLTIVSLLMIFVIGLVVWPMQNAINHVSGDNDGLKNDKLSGSNIFWIVIGLILWAVTIFGLTAAGAKYGSG